MHIMLTIVCLDSVTNSLSSSVMVTTVLLGLPMVTVDNDTFPKVNVLMISSSNATTLLVMVRLMGTIWLDKPG